MAQVSGRRGGMTLMTLVTLAIVAPSLLMETHVAPIPPNAPPALDSFLGRVSRATPPGTRVLAAGAPPALVFYRATYLLYPRTVYSAFATDYAHGATVPSTRWSDLRRLAQRDGARYVLLWALPRGVGASVPRGMVRVRDDAGTLVEVAP